VESSNGHRKEVRPLVSVGSRWALHNFPGCPPNVVIHRPFGQHEPVNVASRSRLICVAAFASFTATAPAAAVSRGGAVEAQLDYVAAPNCPPVIDFEAVVSERLGYDPFAPNASEQVVVRIEAVGSALEGRIEWRSSSGERAGERRFPSRSGDCGELVRAMGFALALQIQLMTMDAPPPESPRAALPNVPPPATAIQPTTVVIPAAPQAPSDPHPGSASSAPGAEPTLWAGIGASAGLGMSPHVSAMGGLFGRAEWTVLALELAAEASGERSWHRSDGTGFSERLALAGLALCGSRDRWSACAASRIGEIRVRGDGVDVPATATGLVLQTGLRLGASQSIGKWAYITAHVDGFANLARGTVTLDAMPVWTNPRFAATLGLRAYVRFW